MLKVSHVSKSYDDILAVDDLSFQVREGEIFGLYSITDRIGFLTEERSLLLKLTVKEQVYYYGSLKGMNKTTIEDKLNYWLDRLNMTEFKNKKLKELSKGNQQKVQFITSIINDPKLLILDEPFTSLDPFNVSLLVQILNELSKIGTIVIFSSHRMEHVEMFCERLLILVKGKTVLEGKLQEIKKNYRKKNIHIIADIEEKCFFDLTGIEKVQKTPEEMIITVSDESVISKVFDVIRECKNVTKFLVEDPSLNEIFVSIVGDVYES